MAIICILLRMINVRKRRSEGVPLKASRKRGKGLKEKSAEFVDKAGEVYLKV